MASRTVRKFADKDELASQFRFLGRVTPPDVQIFCGTQVDNYAWLDFATRDNSSMGSMQTLRIDGRWLVGGGRLRQ